MPEPMQPVAAQVAANMRTLRKRHRWSARQLADKLPIVSGLSQPTIANIENGRREYITVDELAGLALAFGYDYPWMLTEKLPPACPVCSDSPPPGYQCLQCGAHTSWVDGGHA